MSLLDTLLRVQNSEKKTFPQISSPSPPSSPFCGISGEAGGDGGDIPEKDFNYHARVEAALQATCHPDYPAGMVQWLETSDPALYEELTSRLPDLIHQLWTAHAPLEEFQRIVDAWLAAHGRGCELYREHLRRSQTCRAPVRKTCPRSFRTPQSDRTRRLVG